MSEGLRDLAAYDAMRAQQVANVQAARGEAADALVVEALRDRPWDGTVLGQERARALIGALDTLIEAARELQDVAPSNPLAPIAIWRGQEALAAMERA